MQWFRLQKTAHNSSAVITVLKNNNAATFSRHDMGLIFMDSSISNLYSRQTHKFLELKASLKWYVNI